MLSYPEKKQRWVEYAKCVPGPGGEGVTRRVLAFTDNVMCVENRFEKGAVGSLHMPFCRVVGEEPILLSEVPADLPPGMVLPAAHIHLPEGLVRVHREFRMVL